MPTIIRQSGPKFEKDGEIKTPKALVHFCEDRGAENAPFLINVGGKLLSYCGWREGKPVCVTSGELLPRQLLARPITQE